MATTDHHLRGPRDEQPPLHGHHVGQPPAGGVLAGQNTYLPQQSVINYQAYLLWPRALVLLLTSNDYAILQLLEPIRLYTG